MSELAATTAEPAYINRLALNHLPFAKVTTTAAFYDGSHIKQRRLLLQHLLRSTRTPVLLQAAEGMGKTTLLQQMQRQPVTDLRYCTVTPTANTLASDESITAKLEADIQSPHDTAACEAAIRQRVEQLRRVNIVPVLVVDDIKQLPQALQQQLNDWLQWLDADNEPLWQAVISSQLQVNMNSVTLQKLDMPLLEASEIAPYLQHRLQAAGYKDDLPFNSKDLRRFYRLSGGNPGKLNQLAHQQLLGMKAASAGQDGLSQLLKLAGRWTVVAILGLVIIVALIYQQQINSWIKKPEAKQEAISLPPLAEDDVATVVVGEEPTPEVEPRQELADLLAEIPQTDNTLGDTKTETETGTETKEPVPQMQNADGTASETMSASQLDTLPQQEEASSQVAKDSDQTTSDAHGPDWILDQQPGEYTFQLMGAWNAEEVDEFIDKNALSGQLARFTSLRDNKPWHVLIYGVYEGKQEAMNASNSWPAPLNTLPTWLRRFDSVQTQIREKGVSSP